MVNLEYLGGKMCQKWRYSKSWILGCRKRYQKWRCTQFSDFFRENMDKYLKEICHVKYRLLGLIDWKSENTFLESSTRVLCGVAGSGHSPFSPPLSRDEATTSSNARMKINNGKV